MNFSQLFPVRISTCVQFPLVLRHFNPLEKPSTSSEVPQNHNDLNTRVCVSFSREMSILKDQCTLTNLT